MKQQLVTKPRERLAHAVARHRELDARLHELRQRGYLTVSDQSLERDLKKKKLLAKDEIASLERHLRIRGAVANDR